MLNPVSAAEKPRKRKKWDVANPQGEPLQAGAYLLYCQAESKALKPSLTKGEVFHGQGHSMNGLLQQADVNSFTGWLGFDLAPSASIALWSPSGYGCASSLCAFVHFGQVIADPKKPSAFLRPNPQFPLRPTAQISPLGIHATAQAPGVRAPLPDVAVPEAMSAVEIAERAKRGALSVLNKINQVTRQSVALTIAIVTMELHLIPNYSRLPCKQNLNRL